MLVEVILDGRSVSADVEPLNELTRLTEAAGGTVVGTLIQRRREIDAGLYVGRGKAEEIRLLAQARQAHVVVFDNDLTPAQIRNLEEAIHIKVLDRSELILDIFATRARTAEARLQVELAQLEYTYPRLRRMWTHLSRIEGGIGTRGPGETQLETDRRMARQRITDLKARISQIENRREREVRSRKSEFAVCLVGYTNAGKSSLLNALTDADAYVEDQLFATLDTRTRTWMLPFRLKVLLSDTVGFVRKLPHHLVTSFKATLEEALHADLLLHVVDASAPDIDGQVAAVNDVLDEIGCKDQPRLIVLNKIDRLLSRDDIDVLEYRYPGGVPVSAATGDGLESLRGAVLSHLGGQVRDLTVRGPTGDGAWQATLARHAESMRREFADATTIVHTRLPQHLADYLLQEYPELEITLHPLAEGDLGGARRSAS